MTNEITIGTHDGIFHCDDALAFYLLKQLPENRDAKVIRTRDNKLLDQCTYVVDVGGVYDHERKRYDHHQRSFAMTMKDIFLNKNFDIKLSSAGLIFAHYGHRIIANMMNIENENDERVDKIFDKVYENFLIEIDAIDNGIAIADGELRYGIHTNLSSRVKSFLPTWLEETSAEILLRGFHRATELTGFEFTDAVNYYANVWLPAREFIKDAIEKRFTIDEGGEIIEINCKHGLPWKWHLFELEKENDLENVIKCVIVKNNENDWRVQPVPIDPDSFSLRIPLHKEWLGLRDDELSLKAGIEQCIFVHATGFIGGNRTREGAISMAKKSIEFFKSA